MTSDRGTVAILGCGPAGLLAAHACVLAEQPFTIISRKEKSLIGGAQFLHQHIPALTSPAPDGMVELVPHGSTDVYREKVYGPEPSKWPANVSFPTERRVQDAWSMQKAYDILWDIYDGMINNDQVTPQLLDDLLDRFKFVINTVPAHAVCFTAQGARPGQCQFRSVEININHGGAGEYLHDNTIVYDGTKDSSWARASKIFGHGFTEYGNHRPKPPGVRMVSIRKPISTTCDCWSQRNLLRAGRMGEWRKGVLVHDAYNKVTECLMGGM